MNVKIKWLRNKLNLLDMQGMIVSNPVNIYYLTGISMETEGTLLITRKENIYITDSRYIESVNRVLTIDDEIIVYNVKDVSKDDYENFFMFCENVGFEEAYVTYAKYKEYMHMYKINNLVETENLLENQRMVKDEEEIECIKKACKITDDCFEHLCNFIKKGMTEKQIAMEIEQYFKMNGAEGTSFDSIVASGPNSSMPHAVPTERKIEAGDPITIDFGCTYKGYCSDMTRTIFMEYVPEEIKPIYNLVLKNQNQTLDEMKEGANARILTMMVESDFKIHGYTLDHSLGHGLGLEIHESPTIGRKDYLLKDNMTVTDEPGIYIPGKFGVRIEDTVQITKNGCIKLTNSDKNYIILK
ncbi:MAG TPA: aminopeptidase P family protein [Candidatus Merdicola faecigallinarum]|uniref:Aminopeptidase P family protein n=1 Tax=Candidatus Merdicola faecigallinarum TaxID=2840862 RepID=A0A9D1S8R1_9FIRM|nr:aminopeptidase P family protein [Candidatus Merdicola faecigallinarum]